MQTIIDLKNYVQKISQKSTSYLIETRGLTYDDLFAEKVYLKAFDSGIYYMNDEDFGCEWVDYLTPKQEDAKRRYLVNDPLFLIQEYIEDYVKIKHPAAQISDKGFTYKVIGLERPDPLLEEITQALSDEREEIYYKDSKEAYDDLVFSPFYFFKELEWNDLGFKALVRDSTDIYIGYCKEKERLDRALKGAGNNQSLIEEIQGKQLALLETRNRALSERQAKLLELIWPTAKRDAQRAKQLKRFETEIRQRLKSTIKDLIPLIVRADDEEFDKFLTLLMLSIKKTKQDRNAPIYWPNNNPQFTACTTKEGQLPPFVNITPKGAPNRIDARIRFNASYDEDKIENVSFKELIVYTIAHDLWNGRIGPINVSDIPKRIKKNGRVRPEEIEAVRRILKKGEHTESVVELRKWDKQSPKYLLGPEDQTDLAKFEIQESQKKNGKGSYLSEDLLATAKLRKTILKIELWLEIEAKNQGKSYTFWMSEPPNLGVINDAFNQFIEIDKMTFYTLIDGFSFADDVPEVPWDLVYLFLRLLNYPEREEWVLSYDELFGRKYLNYSRDRYTGGPNIKRDNWRFIERVGRNFEKAGLMRMLTDHQSGIIRLLPLAKALPESSPDEARKRRAPSKIDKQLLKSFIKEEKETFNLFTGEADIAYLREVPYLILTNEPKEVSKGTYCKGTFEVKCKLDPENKQVIKFTKTHKRKKQLKAMNLKDTIGK